MARNRWLRAGVSIAAVALFAWLSRGYWGEIDRLKQLPLWLVPILAALYLAMRWLNGLAMRAALVALGHRITVYEAFMLAVLTTYGNLLVPRAGLGVPAIYLRATRGISYTDFTTQAVVVTIVQTAVLGAAGLACVIAISVMTARATDWLIGSIFLGAMLAGLGVLVVKPLRQVQDRTGLLARIRAVLARASVAWHTVGRSPKAVLAIILLDLPMLVLRAVRLQLVFWAVGAEVDFLATFVASALADVMFLVSLTPSGLGFREAAITYSATLLGVTPAVALSVSVIDRLIWTAAVVLVAQVGMWHLITPALAKLGGGLPPVGGERSASSTSS